MKDRFGFYSVCLLAFAMIFSMAWGACGPGDTGIPDASELQCVSLPCACSAGQQGYKACQIAGVNCGPCMCPTTPEPASEPKAQEPAQEAQPEPDAEPPVDASVADRAEPISDLKSPEPPREASPDGPFPDAWAGIWKGPLQIYANGRLQQTIQMELHIGTLSAGKALWKIVYIQGLQPQVRNYELQVVNAATGHYRIDEKNSIVIDNYLFGSTLEARFAVSGNLLAATYRKDGEVLFFEIRSGSSVSTTTGGQGGAPPVLIYPVGQFQQARLTRTTSP